MHIKSFIMGLMHEIMKWVQVFVEWILETCAFMHLKSFLVIVIVMPITSFCRIFVFTTSRLFYFIYCYY